MLGKITEIKIEALFPLNVAAQHEGIIESSLIGGNLSLILRSLGLKKMGIELNCKNKILFFEDLDEPFRKIDGMLYQLECAGFFDSDCKPQAVIVGECSHNDPVEKISIMRALNEFAQRLEQRRIPVFSCPLIGHQKRNHPLPIGTKAILQLGKKPSLRAKI